MEYDKIKQLMEDMGNSKLTSIDIDFPDGTKISMKKEKNSVLNTNDLKEEYGLKNTNEDNKKMEPIDIEKSDNNYKIVKSPMVGTFYLKPSPDSEPYVKIGDRIKKGDTLCIIEAMKLMNEIESEFDGEVVEILIEDGQMVDYSKPLFKIK